MRPKLIRFTLGLLVGLLLTLGFLTSRPSPRMSPEKAAMAKRMHSYVRALFEPPVNEQPASQWSPLVSGTDFSCAVCHGAAGEGFERQIAEGLPETESVPKLTHERNVELMEEWVEQLNHDAGHLLRKAVVCTDCHERDPRRE